MLSVKIPLNEHTKPLLTQLVARPMGFGLIETFCPLLSVGTHSEIVKKRKMLWGLDHDVMFENYSPTRSIDRDGHRINFSYPMTAIVSAVFEMFGGVKKLKIDLAETRASPELFDPVDVKIAARWIAARKKVTRVPADAHEIFKLTWHQCQHCDKRFTEHVNGQCLFASTKFTPMCTEWRTLIGDFAWEPKSGSFVSVVGSMTTTTTTATTKAARQSKATAVKTPQRKPRKKETLTESKS